MCLAFEDLDQLRPCTRCGSLRFWFDEFWRCEHCDPPSTSLAGLIRVELDPPTAAGAVA
jgi:hypothetical protein